LELIDMGSLETLYRDPICAGCGADIVWTRRLPLT